MNTSEMLSKMIEIAAKAHSGQFDKADYALFCKLAYIINQNYF